MDRPAHPYTRLLMDSIQRIGDKWKDEVAMPDIESKEYLLNGCKFAPRCAYATEECRKARPEMKYLKGDRKVLCFHPLIQE